MTDKHIEAGARAIFRDVTGYDLERHDGSGLDKAVWQDALRHSALAARAWLDSVGLAEAEAFRVARMFMNADVSHDRWLELAEAIRVVQQ